MKAPICVPCKQEMRCKKNGCVVNDPASGSFPATYWFGNKWRCPKCGHEIIVGLSADGLSADELDTDKIADSLEFAYT